MYGSVNSDGAAHPLRVAYDSAIGYVVSSYFSGGKKGPEGERKHFAVYDSKGGYCTCPIHLAKSSHQVLYEGLVLFLLQLSPDAAVTLYSCDRVAVDQINGKDKIKNPLLAPFHERLAAVLEKRSGVKIAFMAKRGIHEQIAQLVREKKGSTGTAKINIDGGENGT